MGLRHLTRQIAADAGVHVVHVGRWSADFQHGYRRDALAFSVQESVLHEYRFVNVSSSIFHDSHISLFPHTFPLFQLIGRSTLHQTS